jgi:hypothetical protein
MRVELDNVDDFLGEINRESDHLWERCVRYQVSRMPEQDDEITFKVGLWLTAIVAKESGNWIIEMFAFSGRDEDDEPRMAEGSNAADAWLSRVRTACEDLDLKLHPGKIELV